MTYDDGGDRRVHLFLNGAEVTYSVHLTASGSVSSDTATTQNIGRRSNGDRYFGGKLDEVAIWNRALSPTEINDVFVGGVIAPPTLTSIAVSPVSSSIVGGQTQQFAAQATFSDGSTADVTATATWESSNTTAATIDSLGLATAILAGSTNITATQDAVVSNIAVLDVTAPPPPPTIVSIAVSPATASIEEGQTQQFTAQATFRAYPTTPAARNVIHAQAKCSIAK